jgi:hypothetical protein
MGLIGLGIAVSMMMPFRSLLLYHDTALWGEIPGHPAPTWEQVQQNFYVAAGWSCRFSLAIFVLALVNEWVLRRKGKEAGFSSPAGDSGE